MCVAVGLHGLLDCVVVADGAGVCGTANSVLVIVADVAFAVAGGGGLAGEKGGCGDGGSEGEDEDEVLGEVWWLAWCGRDGWSVSG